MQNNKHKQQSCFSHEGKRQIGLSVRELVFLVRSRTLERFSVELDVLPNFLPPWSTAVACCRREPGAVLQHHGLSPAAVPQQQRRFPRTSRSVSGFSDSPFWEFRSRWKPACSPLCSPGTPVTLLPMDGSGPRASTRTKKRELCSSRMPLFPSSSSSGYVTSHQPTKTAPMRHARR